MKRLVLALMVTVLASCSTAGGPIQITNQTLASHSASSPYVIDLTDDGNGKAYDVASDVDYSRLAVRTDIPMEDFIRQRGGQAGQRVLLGELSDLVVLLPSDSEGTVAAQCQGGTCTCTGRKDCSDLSKSGKCKSGPNDAICGKGYGGRSGWGCTCASRK